MSAAKWNKDKNQWHEIGRTIFAAVFLLGAIANSLILFCNPGMYLGFADLSFLPFYQRAWLTYIVPELPFFVGFVIVFECTLAIMLLHKGRSVHVGLLLAAVFMLFLVPFWWSGGGLLNLIFFILLLLLSRFAYPLSVIQRWKRRSAGSGN